MFPLIKIKKFHYKINGHYFGLSVDPLAEISCIGDRYTAKIGYKTGAIKKFETNSFRKAFNFLVDNAVKHYFNY